MSQSYYIVCHNCRSCLWAFDRIASGVRPSMWRDLGVVEPFMSSHVACGQSLEVLTSDAADATDYEDWGQEIEDHFEDLGLNEDSPESDLRAAAREWIERRLYGD